MNSLKLVLTAPDVVESRSGTDLPRLPKQLGRLFRQPSRCSLPSGGRDAHLFALMGVDVSTLPPPVGAVSRLFDGGSADERWWIRMDPVHLMPNRDFLVLRDAGSLSLSQQQAEGLVHDILTVFGEDRWDVQALTPQRWYLSVPRPPRLLTTALHDVVDKNIDHFLPLGEDAHQWRGFQTEIQMILHNSAVNQEREAAGLPPINSVWFWGEGVLPAAQSGHWQTVWSNDPVAGGLAHLTGCSSMGLPERIDEVFTGESLGQSMVVLPVESVVHAPSHSFEDAVEYLVAEWVEPAVRALKSGRLDALSLDYIDDRGVMMFDRVRRFTNSWWRF